MADSYASGLVPFPSRSLLPLVQRVEAAKNRIGELNPLVTIEVIPDAIASLLREREQEEIEGGLDKLVGRVDMVCATDLGRDESVRFFF